MASTSRARRATAPAATREDAAPIDVLIVADTPEHDHTLNPRQPSSTLKGYLVVGQEGEDVAAVLERSVTELGTFGLGTTFYAIDASECVKRVLASALEEPAA